MNYEEELKSNIYHAIELKSQELLANEEFSSFLNSLVESPHHPLLTDKKWMYDHVEALFVHAMFSYQRNQGPEEYYLLFKTLIEKYDVEEDYEKLLNNPEHSFWFQYKWELFAVNIVDFIAHAFDYHGVLEDLFHRDDFLHYFFKYPKLYNHNKLEHFNDIGISQLLNYESFASYYLENPDRLIRLMRMNPRLLIPQKLFLDNRFKKIAHDINVENFYFTMRFVWESSSGFPCLEEHQKFCDYEVSHVNEGILPCLREEYDSSPDDVTFKLFQMEPNKLKRQTIRRIFELSKKEKLPKLEFYQELSKYIVVGLLMSRCFETSPYNLLIDIKTLFQFARDNQRILQGDSIYEFLIHFEEFDVFYILDFYQKIKDLPLKDILYDDWENQRIAFIEEMNHNLMNPNQLTPIQNNDGVLFYDISNLENSILVHNSNESMVQPEKINRLIHRIQTGEKHRLCLSLQDLDHQEFFCNDKTDTIKFVYGPLDPMRVGITNHEDAYSQGMTTVEYNNVWYKRRLYTLKEFMMDTSDYNEIDYLINGTPFLPIGILCEKEPTSEEILVAKKLNIAIFYRFKKSHEKDSSPKHKMRQLTQRYEWQVEEMRLFPKNK